ncbi:MULTISPECIES: hypothetical protein [Paraburkholderia]|uniref:hypothetical protein n=1 Tax=Paraburkholderia TaxID=1822464 RepID=UPI0003812194|nr:MULTISPECIES: hypothetical protein [Paraburkholderia]MDH6146333.1 hypothetical protein [Paraburkholderia sp. WSM4179]
MKTPVPVRSAFKSAIAQMKCPANAVIGKKRTVAIFVYFLSLVSASPSVYCRNTPNARAITGIESEGPEMVVATKRGADRNGDGAGTLCCTHGLGLVRRHACNLQTQADHRADTKYPRVVGPQNFPINRIETKLSA